MLKQLVKNAFHSVGLRVEWRDRLAEQIPSIYAAKSSVLPDFTRDSVARVLYYHDLVRLIRGVDGDVMECGVCVGHSLMVLVHLNELEGMERTYLGYDSFEGFPPPTDQDGATHAFQGYMSTAPEVVLRVMRASGVGEETIQKRLRLVRGFFEQTVPHYQGRLALLHLDGDLYSSYKVCLDHLYDKVVPGGVIMFDEYGDPKWPGAEKAVNEFLADKPERPVRHSVGKYYLVKQA